MARFNSIQKSRRRLDRRGDGSQPAIFRCLHQVVEAS